MSSIEAAIEVLRSQNPPRYAATAREFNVDRNTLMRRFKGLHQSMAEYHADGDSLLNTGQSQYLVKYINIFTDRGIPPTHRMIRNFAFNLSQTWPGKNWTYRWVKRNSKHLSSGYIQAFELERKKADNSYQYSLYFDLVSGPESGSYPTKL